MNALDITFPALTSIFGNLGDIINMILGSITTALSTIMGNALFWAPVALCLGAGVISLGVKYLRKLGVNGIGRRRKKRRAR